MKPLVILSLISQLWEQNQLLLQQNQQLQAQLKELSCLQTLENESQA